MSVEQLQDIDNESELDDDPRGEQPLLGRHHLWFPNFLYAAFFAWAAPFFLQFGCFYVDLHILL